VTISEPAKLTACVYSPFRGCRFGSERRTACRVADSLGRRQFLAGRGDAGSPDDLAHLRTRLLTACSPEAFYYARNRLFEESTVDPVLCEDPVKIALLGATFDTLTWVLAPLLRVH